MEGIPIKDFMAGRTAVEQVAEANPVVPQIPAPEQPQGPVLYPVGEPIPVADFMRGATNQSPELGPLEGAVNALANVPLDITKGLLGAARGVGAYGPALARVVQDQPGEAIPSRLDEAISSIESIQRDLPRSGSLEQGPAFQPKNWRWWTEGGTSAIGQVAGVVGSSMLAGPVAGLAILGTQAGGNAYLDAKKRMQDRTDLTEEEKELYSTGEGAIVGVSESLLGRLPLGEYIRRTPRARSAFTSLVSRKLAGTATGRAAGMLGAEMTEETGNELTAIMAQWMVENDPKAWQDWKGRLAAAGTMGAVGAGPFALQAGAGQLTRNLEAAGLKRGRESEIVKGAAMSASDQQVEAVFQELAASPNGRDEIRRLATLEGGPSRTDFERLGLSPRLHRMGGRNRTEVAAGLQTRLNQLEAEEQQRAEQVSKAGPPDAGGGAWMEAGPVPGTEPEGGPGVRGGGPAEIQAAGPEARPEEPVVQPAPPPVEQPAAIPSVQPAEPQAITPAVQPSPARVEPESLEQELQRRRQSGDASAKNRRRIAELQKRLRVGREALKRPAIEEPAPVVEPAPAAELEGAAPQVAPQVAQPSGPSPPAVPIEKIEGAPIGQQAPEVGKELGSRPGIPKQYVKPDGMVELIHFTESEEPEIELSPTEGWKKQNLYSVRERRSAITPRTFHYLNEADREPEIRGRKYTSLVDPASIYNLKEDPLGLKGRGRIPSFGTKIDAILEDVQQEGYSGVYYQAGSLELVSMLKPVRMKRADIAAKPAEIPAGQQAIPEPAPSQQPVAPAPAPAVELERERVSEEVGLPASVPAPQEPARKVGTKWEPSQEEYERTRPERAKRLQASMLRMRGRNPTAEQVDEWLKFAEAKQLALQDLKREKIGTVKPKVGVERAAKVEEIKKRVEAGQSIEGEAPPAPEAIDRELLAALREPGRREFIPAPTAPEGAAKTIGQPSKTGGIRGLRRGKAGAIPQEGEVAPDIGEVARATAERVGPSGESNEKKFFKIWRDMIRSVRKQIGAIFRPKPVLKRHVLKTIKAEGKIPSPGPATDQAINQDGLDHNTEEGVLDVIQFLIDNPKYTKYYKEDQVRLFRALEQFFPVLELEGSDARRKEAQDHRDMVSFLMAIASAQSNLKDNTSETIDAFRGFLEYGSIPVVFEEIDLGDGVVHREPVYRLPGTVEQALKAIHQMDQDGVAMPEMVEREGRMVRVDSLTRDDQVKIRDKIGKRKSSQTKRPYSTTMGTSSGNMALERLEEWRNSGTTNTERDEVFSGRNRTPFIIAGGTSAYNKAFNYNTVNNLLKYFGGDIGKIIQWIKEEVSIKQLQQDKAQHARRIDEPKETSQIGSKDDILDTVWVATGQMDLIPRAFMFGPKVGAYIMNHLGDSRYTTQDVWESRFWRSLNNIGDTDLGIASGLPRRIYMRESARFTDKIKEMVRSGKLGAIDPETVKLIEDMENADGQAGRWYFIIKAARDAGYLGAAAEKGTIADYAEEALDEHILTVELRGGKILEEMSIWEKGIKQLRGKKKKKKKKKKFAAGQMALLGEQEVVARDVEGGVEPEIERAESKEEVPPEAPARRPMRDEGREDIQTLSKSALIGIHLPELVMLAETLMGESPKLKNLGEKLRAYFAAKGSELQIVVNRALQSKSLNAVISSLAHEIGHLVDFKGDTETLARGNLIGRLHSLEYWQKSYEPGTDAEIYRGFNDELMDELRGISVAWRGPIDDPGVKGGNYQYRMKPSELYADAISVLLLQPSYLMENASQFYKTWLEHINNKPDVAREYLMIQQMLAGDSEELAQIRTDRVMEMFQDGAERLAAIHQEIEQAKRSPMELVKDFIAGGLLHRQGRILRRMGRTVVGFSTDVARLTRYMLDELAHKKNRTRKMLREITQQVTNPLLDLGLSKADLGEYTFFHRIAAGGRELTDESGGTYEAMNPRGHTIETATVQLAAIRKRYINQRLNELTAADPSKDHSLQAEQEGTRKFEKLRKIANKFHDIVWEVVEEAGDSGVYSQKTIEKLRKNKNNYVAFGIVDYLDIHVSPMLQQTKGTWKGTANPIDTTIMKMVSLNRLNQLNATRLAVRNSWIGNSELRLEFVESAIPFGADEVKRRAPAGMEWFYMLDDGVKKAYAVPKEVAWGFDNLSLRELGTISALFSSAVYPVWHKLYIAWNTAFMKRNIFRDVRRSVRLLSTAGSDVGYAEFLKEYFAALTDATDEELEAMRDEYAISTPFARFVADQQNKDELDRYLVEYGLIDGEIESNWVDRAANIVPILRQLNDSLYVLAERTEMASKVAANRILGKRGVESEKKVEYDRLVAEGATPTRARTLSSKILSVRERAFKVRNYSGTPDWQQGGDWTPLTNTFLMFSRVRWTGMGREAGLMTSREGKFLGRKGRGASAGKFFWNLFSKSIVPKYILQYGTPFVFATLFGMFDWDDKDKEEFNLKITQYYLDNYDIVPVGIKQDQNGERMASFYSIPMDDVSRFFSSMISHTLAIGREAAGGETKHGSMGRALGSTLTDAIGEVVPATNPTIDIAWKWLQWAQNINPIDYHFGNAVVPPTEWKAGGWHSAKPIVKWTMNKLGPIGQTVSWAIGPLMDEDRTLEISLGDVLKDVAVGGLYRETRAGEKYADILESDIEQQREAEAKLDLPEVVRKVNREHYYLGQDHKRTDKEETRRRLLNRYNSLYFTPLARALTEARNKGLDDKVKSIKADMKKAAGAMLDQKDAALMPFSELSEAAKPVVQDFLRHLVIEAKKNPPVRQKDESLQAYKWRYENYLDQMIQTLGVVQEVRKAHGGREGDLPARREALRGTRERLKRVEVE